MSDTADTEYVHNILHWGCSARFDLNSQVIPLGLCSYMNPILTFSDVESGIL